MAFLGKARSFGKDEGGSRDSLQKKGRNEEYITTADTSISLEPYESRQDAPLDNPHIQERVHGALVCLLSWRLDRYDNALVPSVSPPPPSLSTRRSRPPSSH